MASDRWRRTEWSIGWPQTTRSPTTHTLSLVPAGSVCRTIGSKPRVRGACVRAARGLGLELARFDLVVCAEHAACVEISQVPDLPDDQGACAELVDALCDLLASGSVAS